MSARFDPVIQEIEFVLAEARQLSALGPHFRIDHRFRKSGTACRAGEEISTVCLIHRSRQYQLRLSLALRILFDCLARSRWRFQTATQIEAAIRADEFYSKHGANAGASRRQVRKISHSAVKEYIKRIRQALQIVFDEAGLNLDPSRVLTAEQMMGTEVGYRLKATATWSHVD